MGNTHNTKQTRGHASTRSVEPADEPAFDEFSPFNEDDTHDLRIEDTALDHDQQPGDEGGVDQLEHVEQENTSSDETSFEAFTDTTDTETDTVEGDSADTGVWSDHPDTIQEVQSAPTDAYPDTATDNPGSPTPNISNEHSTTWFNETSPTEDGLNVYPLEAHHKSDAGVTEDSMFIVEDLTTGAEMYVTVYEPGSGGRGVVGDSYGVEPAGLTTYTSGERLAAQTVSCAATADILNEVVDQTGIPGVKGRMELDDNGDEAWIAVEGVDGKTMMHVTDNEVQQANVDEMLDVMATQLLIGNRDTHSSNVMLGENGDVWVPDIDRGGSDLSGKSLNSDLIEPAQYVQEAEQGHYDPGTVSNVKKQVYEHTKTVANDVLDEYDGDWVELKNDIKSRSAEIGDETFAEKTEFVADKIVNNILAFSDSEQAKFKDEDMLETLGNE